MAVLVASYSGTINDVNNWSNTQSKISREFKPSATGNLDSFTVQLKKSGTPTWIMGSYIYTATGTYNSSGVPNTLYATGSTLDVSTLGTSYSEITFTFSGAEKKELTADTAYHIVLTVSSGSSTWGDVGIGIRFGGDSSSGGANWGGSSWSWQAGANDWWYNLYEEGEATTTSSSTSSSTSTTSTSSSTSTSTTTTSTSTTTTSSSTSSSTTTTSSSTSTTSTSSSTSTTTTIAPDTGGLAFGEQNPVGETAVSWATFVRTGSTISGDADWGKLETSSGNTGNSIVYDFGTSASRLITLTDNKYGTGSGTGTKKIRGQDAVFVNSDGTPTWETYSGPVSKTWRYIQVQVTK